VQQSTHLQRTASYMHICSDPPWSPTTALHRCYPGQVWKIMPPAWLNEVYAKAATERR